MATAEECRAALETLTGRISELDAERRSAYLADRTLSCRVPDLGVTFVTRIPRRRGAGHRGRHRRRARPGAIHREER